MRWHEEDAYGATARDYGFQYGIGHLLAMARHGEAAEMLLDRGYQKACVLSHKKPYLVARDVNRVRHACAQEGEGDTQRAAALCAEALGAETRLTQSLREILDDAAAAGKWEEVMELASAEDVTEGKLLLACRGIMRAQGSLHGQDAVTLGSLMTKWAATVDKPEWREVVTRISAEGASKG